MNIDIVDPLRLPQHLKDRWGEILVGSPTLSSPYFSLTFIETIARCRPGVAVAVFDNGAAFFPFQREAMAFGIARPVGSPISDYHGVVAPPGVRVDVAAALRKAGLVGWEFNHVPEDQRDFTTSASGSAESPFIDLRGWTGGSQKLREQAQNRLRKLEREIGPVAFEFASSNPQFLDQCLQWKSDQYDRSGMYNIFTGRNGPWIRAALQQMAAVDEPGFRGLLSVLTAGGQPIAVHFGLRSGSVLHYWFPAFDIEFRTYSPGTILLLKVAEAAAAAGIATIDLGRGESFYKDRLATGSSPLIEGCVVVAPLAYRLLGMRKSLGRQLRRVGQRSASQA